MSQIYETPEQEVVGLNKSSSGVLSFAKVFLYMFIGLAITAVVAMSLSAVIYYSAVNGADANVLVNTYLGLMIASGISLLVLTFVINFVLLRGRHSILVPAIIYTVLMGVLLSSFCLLIDWRILGLAFGITSGIFLLMTIIASLTKSNLSPLLMVGLGLIVGSLILSLVNWLIQSDTLMWIVTFAIFAAMMFITMFDIWNIKKISERGEMSTNISLYCAFSLYVDFIYIFIRIVYFLIIIFANKR